MVMKLNDDVRGIVASILALGVVTERKRELGESEVMEIFRKMFSWLEKIEKEPGELKYNF